MKCTRGILKFEHSSDNSANELKLEKKQLRSSDNIKLIYHHLAVNNQIT